MPEPDRLPGAGARASATIVLATHARAELLRDCVTDIAAAMRPGDELVVVECCNPDAAEQLAGLPVPITHLAREHEAKCAKLNAALRRAGHEIVVLTDDDCRVPRDWVDEMSAPFANAAVGVVFGPVRGLSELPGSRAGASVPAGPAPPELWNFAHGASMAVRRSALRDIGGFDERLGAGTECRGGEEADVVLRAAARGWRCEIAGGATVEHLEWRDDAENRENLLGYQRGSGAYLGAALRRDPLRASKTLALRLLHERGVWRDARPARGARFGPRMTAALASGLRHGVTLEPRRHLDRESVNRHGADHTSRPRVLWVTDEPPDREQGGGNIRQARLLDAIGERLDVTLLLAGRLDDPDTRARLHSVIEVPAPRPRAAAGPIRRRVSEVARALFSRAPSDVVRAARVRRALQPVLARVGDEYDVVVVHHLHLAPLLAEAREQAWVLHLFDASSERTRQERAATRGLRQRWLLGREIRKAERTERAALDGYDRVVTVSPADATALGGGHAARNGRGVVVPNGVDLGRPPAPLPADPLVLFPGTLDYRPNVLGAQWFCGEVWERVRAEIPTARLVIVGRRPVAAVRALAERDGIELHADVPDMTPWFDRARVVVVPLLAGTGTRIKALEAMAAGRPVAGTTVGLEGLGCVDGEHARLADSPAELADAIVTLLRDDASARRVAAGGRALVEQHFAWEPFAARLCDALEDAAQREPERARTSRAMRRAARPGTDRSPVDACDV